MITARTAASFSLNRPVQVTLNPQPLPPRYVWVTLNPQPLPPVKVSVRASA